MEKMRHPCADVDPLLRHGCVLRYKEILRDVISNEERKEREENLTQVQNIVQENASLVTQYGPAKAFSMVVGRIVDKFKEKSGAQLVQEAVGAYKTAKIIIGAATYASVEERDSSTKNKSADVKAQVASNDPQMVSAVRSIGESGFKWIADANKSFSIPGLTTIGNYVGKYYAQLPNIGYDTLIEKFATQVIYFYNILGPEKFFMIVGTAVPIFGGLLAWGLPYIIRRFSAMRNVKALDNHVAEKVIKRDENIIKDVKEFLDLNPNFKKSKCYQRIVHDLEAAYAKVTERCNANKKNWKRYTKQNTIEEIEKHRKRIEDVVKRIHEFSLSDDCNTQAKFAIKGFVQKHIDECGIGILKRNLQSYADDEEEERLHPGAVAKGTPYILESHPVEFGSEVAASTASASPIKFAPGPGSTSKRKRESLPRRAKPKVLQMKPEEDYESDDDSDFDSDGNSDFTDTSGPSAVSSYSGSYISSASQASGSKIVSKAKPKAKAAPKPKAAIKPKAKGKGKGKGKARSIVSEGDKESDADSELSEYRVPIKPGPKRIKRTKSMISI